MDKQAFKQRMQNLKSYRENNPGKGYWDWKVQAYQNGGRHALGVGQVFASLADMLFNTDKLTKYYSKPTEQKAYMNQLREFMYANKMIDTRDQIVTPDLIKQAISKLPKGMQSIKKASEQFKSMRSYTKWFNTIPLLGVGAVGANKYFTSNENRD